MAQCAVMPLKVLVLTEDNSPAYFVLQWNHVMNQTFCWNYSNTDGPDLEQSWPLLQQFAG